MQIEKPTKPGPRRFIALIAGGLIAAAGLFYALQHGVFSSAPSQKIDALPPLEIANFIGKPESYSKKEKKWVPLQRGAVFSPGLRIRTDAHSEIDLRAKNQVTLRLKENSELERKPLSRKAASDSYRLHLVRGLILGATERKAEVEKWLEISTPAIVAAIRGTVFAVRADEPTKKSWVGVLRGTVEVQSTRKADKVAVRDMEKVESNPDGSLVKAVRISHDEWDGMREAYELITKSVSEESGQLDLSRRAGGIFEHVFDHGTFFTPKVGYAWRTFEHDRSAKVILSIEYDVFPRGSFVGMYMKVNNLNLADYEGMQMRVSRVPETGYPEAFRIEVKSKGQVVRAFTPKVFKKEWQTMRFPFRATKDTPVSEIVFVFSNDKSGEFTRGALQFSDIKLLPKKAEEPSPASAGSPQPNPAPAAAPKAPEKTAAPSVQSAPGTAKTESAKA